MVVGGAGAAICGAELSGAGTGVTFVEDMVIVLYSEALASRLRDC
jgi:hypothetical protein